MTYSSKDIPVLKIGAVVLRAAAGKEGAALSTLEILILRPIPKHAGEVPHFVLPRGSRQYQDAAGDWHDARDVATGVRHAARLEPVVRGLAREVEEEAGVDAAMLARAHLRELGVMAFQSRTKGVYPIHWFVVQLTEEDAAAVAKAVPVDATELRWVSFETIQAMATRGEFSAGYVSVIAAALSA